MKKWLALLLILLLAAAILVIFRGRSQKDDWDAYGTVSIVPPEDTHPRLLITRETLREIEDNLTADQNRDAYELVKELAAIEEDGSLPFRLAYPTNYSDDVLRIAEAKAFLSLIDDNRELAEEAVTIIRNFLDTVDFMSDYNGRVSRSSTLFTAALVYDWCYDSMDERERMEYIEACEKTAEDGFMGWPPSELTALTGYGSETYLLKDCLAMAVAFYDERPEIYHYTAGRIIEEYLPAREEYHKSGILLQGTSYGPERFYGDLFAGLIFSAFTEELSWDDMFSEVAYGMLYLLRPDGQPFRLGDDYVEKFGGGFSKSYAPAFLYLSSWLNDSVLKGMYYQCFDSYDYREGIYSPVLHLILNDPDLEGTGAETLPLTRYFGSPEGLMVARTGWEFGEDSPDTVVMMKIGERWGSNHAHLDAGTFQIFHRGAVAAKSGYYDGYNTLHETGYNKRSVSQNSISIYAEDEPETEYSVSWYPAEINDGGQRWPAGGAEPDDLAEWTSGDFDRAKVLGAFYDTESELPAYSFLKGDITGSYWEGKAAEVIRNMLFIPLDEEDGTSAFLVFDKVSSQSEEQKKSVLLQAIAEPQIEEDGAGVRIDLGEGNGKLEMKILLPQTPQVKKLGGAGKNFLVNGQNLEPESEPGEYNESGYGRIEISSSEDNLTEYFLQAFFISDSETDMTEMYDSCELVETEFAAGAVFPGYLVLFARDANGLSEETTITLPNAENRTAIIAGLAKGRWTVTAGDKSTTHTVAETNGVLKFRISDGCTDITLNPVYIETEE